MNAMADVLVVGGGVIGLAIAREAARSGLSVLLLERGETGCEASGASAGMLAAQLEGHDEGPLARLCLDSRALFPAFLDAVETESGIGVDRRTEGAIEVARGDAAAMELERSCRRQRERGLPVELLDAAALRRAEPALRDDACLGLLLPLEHTLDPPALLRALRVAAERTSVRILTSVEVTRVTTANGRVSGVATAGGAKHAAAQVVIAAGAWSGSIVVDGWTMPRSEPVRGQIVCYRAADLLRHVVATDDCYLVPRGDGRILVGSTMERAGFDRRVTAQGVETLGAAAIALVPALAGAALHGAWAGLRPGSDDGLPLLGPGGPEGLLHAWGHLRNGIVLTPLTARVIAGLLRGEAAGPDLKPFDPRRFSA
jgi:glycine oxidase